MRGQQDSQHLAKRGTLPHLKGLSFPNAINASSKNAQSSICSSLFLHVSVHEDITWEPSDGRDAQGKVSGKGHKASMFSECVILPKSPHVHQLGSYPTPSFWVFMEAALQRYDLVNHWLLANELNLQLFFSGWWWWWRDLKFQSSNHMICSPGNQPHP